MRRSSLLPLVLAPVALAACADSAVQPTPLRAPMSIAASSASAPLRNDSVDPILFSVRTGPNATSPKLTDPPGTLLWTARPFAGPGKPVIAPDGHQLTLGEWITPTGRAAIKCIAGGTHTVVHLSGLIPNGTYTMWQFVFNAPNTPPAGVGALGPGDGSANSFRASSSGEGELTVVTPGGNLGIFGSIHACALDEFEVHYLAAYHIDGMTHGRFPGPDGTVAEDAGIRFHMP